MNKKFKKLTAACITMVAGMVLWGLTASAATPDISSAIIQSYNADPSVVVGMIVGLKDKGHNTVVPLTNSGSRNMLGVVIPENNAIISLSPPPGSSQEVLVATSGQYQALVSNQNGTIKQGDYLTISSLPGIAMKANVDQQYVIGRAADNYGKDSKAIDTVNVKDRFGHTTPAAIGRININLRLAPNPSYQSSNGLPGVVSKTAENLVNKPLTLAQIYLSLALLVLTFFIAGVILYSGVRNGIISIGRNPLSRKSIIAGLFKVLLLGLIILGVGVGAAYLALKF